MGQKIRTLTMLTILLCTTSVTSLAQAPLAVPKQAEHRPTAPATETTTQQAPDISALLQRVSTIPDFTDWQAVTAVPLRALHNPEGRQNALLWSVTHSGQPAGYLVTSPDGVHLYEFSKGAVPALPQSMLGKELAEGYIYAGPMLHLVYYHTNGATLDLYNLQTGETLPWGELKNRVASPSVVDATQTKTTEQTIETSQSPDSDALYATGRFGQHKLDPAKQKGVHPLQSFAAGDTFSQPSYIVYDAVPDKLYITLQVTKVISQGNVRYVQVQDPFAQSNKNSVYIDSRFPVSVFLTESSAT